jgi:hypothetical protein
MPSAISVNDCVRSAVSRKPPSADTRDKSAHGFRLRHFDARQCPIRFAERLVAFQAKLDHLPVGNRLAINNAQLRVRSPCRHFCIGTLEK